MNFYNSLSKIAFFLFLFGLCPFILNRKTNKFECTACTLAYTVVYYTSVSVARLYCSYDYLASDDATNSILSFFKFIVVLALFISTLVNLMVNAQNHSNFFNKLLDIELVLAKFNVRLDHGHLRSQHMEHILIVVFYALIYAIEFIVKTGEATLSAQIWYTLQFFENTTLTLVGYYIRCIAITLSTGCRGVVEYIDVHLRHDLLLPTCKSESIVELLNSLKAFDDLMQMKKQISETFGILLLFTTSFDFIVVTIAIFKVIDYSTNIQFEIWIYFLTYHLPHIIQCVLLTEALNTLAEQVRDAFRMYTSSLVHNLA